MSHICRLDTLARELSAMLHGSIHHVSLTVADLRGAMRFFGPLLEFLGNTVGEVMHDPRSDHDRTVDLDDANGTAVNIWQAEPDLAEQRARERRSGGRT